MIQTKRDLRERIIELEALAAVLRVTGQVHTATSLDDCAQYMRRTFDPHFAAELPQ